MIFPKWLSKRNNAWMCNFYVMGKGGGRGDGYKKCSRKVPKMVVKVIVKIKDIGTSI